MSARRTMLAPLIALALGGCMDAGLAWTYAIDDQIADVSLLAASVEEGRCGSGSDPGLHFFRQGEETRGALRPLGSGEHCFRIEAFDSRCALRGEGISAIDLPTDQAAVHVVVHPVTSDGMPQDRCISGLAAIGQ